MVYSNGEHVEILLQIFGIKNRKFGTHFPETRGGGLLWLVVVSPKNLPKWGARAYLACTHSWASHLHCKSNEKCVKPLSQYQRRRLWRFSWHGGTHPLISDKGPSLLSDRSQEDCVSRKNGTLFDQLATAKYDIAPPIHWDLQGIWFVSVLLLTSFGTK